MFDMGAFCLAGSEHLPTRQGLASTIATAGKQYAALCQDYLRLYQHYLLK
jgi:hypothetical protein